MWLYSDLLEINQQFYEVFSESADRDDTSYWKSFIPHETMEKLLDNLLRSLEGSSKKSLWIYGPYGTGKTHAQFLLKHLLEDPWAEVEGYSQAHGLKKDLLKRLEAVRARGQGTPGLVIYRASSASVTSHRKLMAEVQHAIKQALAARGISALPTATLYEQILQRLGGDGQIFDWPRAFAKHRGRFMDFTSAEEVVARLRAVQGSERIRLMDLVAQVMDEEGFYLLDDPKTVATWIRDVMKAQALPWLVFMWDEFTDFFLNVTSLSGLQELAQLSAELPFVFLLATHRSPEILQRVQGSFKEDWSKLLDRFTHSHYEMEPLTAYRLMRLVVRPRAGAEPGWSQAQQELWEEVRRAVRHLLSPNEPPDDLCALAPIHPYSAYLLSQIAQHFSSSQRTLFRFLKQDAAGAFPAFLRTHPQEGWRWYTADNLWDYFFDAGGPELPSGFRDMVSYYHSRQGGITEDGERRAFKAAMLLLGLSREVPNVPRLSPTLSNLRALFVGTPLGGQIESVLEALCQRDLLRSVNARSLGDRQYTIPSTTIDHKAVEDIQKTFRFRDEMPLARNSLGTRVFRLFNDLQEEVLRRRQALAVVSAEELEGRREKVVPRCEPYQVPVVMVAAQNEEERLRALELCRRLMDDGAPSALWVVPEHPFTDTEWANWTEDRALACYCRENSDAQNAQFHEDAATQRLKTWVQALRGGAMQAFAGGEAVNAIGVEGYTEVLGSVVARRFPHRPEKLSTTSTLYKESCGATGAEIGLGISGPIKAPYNVVVEQLERKGLWPAGLSSATETAPDSQTPLGAMAATLQEVMSQRDMVSLNEIIGMLQAPPFGLIPSPMGIVLTGLLLRDYVDGYYYRDGTNTFPLDRTKMAELINAILHDKGGQVQLSRTTPEVREFCALLGQVFELSPEESRYPEPACRAARSFITNAGYPLWALRYTPLGERCAEGLAAWERALRQNDLSNEAIAALLPDLRRSAGPVSELVRQRCFQGGMQHYLASSAPQLPAVAKSLHLPETKLTERLRDIMNAEVWLWREEEILKRLPDVQAELEMVLALNAVLGKADISFAEVVSHLRGKLQDGKLPLFVLREQEDEALRDLLDEVETFLQNPQTYPGKGDLASRLHAQREGLRTALNDRLSPLIRWIESHLGVAVTPEEAARLLEDLPSRATYNAELFRTQILKQIQDMSKQKLITELFATWRETTNSDSPEAWSSGHQVPAHWVLDGQEYLPLLTILGNPQNYTEKQIEAAIALMGARRAELSRASQDDAGRETLARLALGAYRLLAQSEEELKALHLYIRQRAGPVATWKQEQIQRLGQEWVNTAYKEHIYRKVLSRVDETPESQLRELVKELVQDPLVGAKLLQTFH